MNVSHAASRFFPAALCLILAGCGMVSQERMKTALILILADDLEQMVAETKKGDSGAALDRPYYRVEEYKITGESFQFACKAEVTFYYYKTIRMKQTRKYRFSSIQGKWERYSKVMSYNLPKPRAKGSVAL